MAGDNFLQLQDIDGGINTFIGYEAGNSTTSAGRNVAIGSYALENSQTSERNVAIGYEALEGSTTADYSVALGYRAGSSNSGNYNTFVGYEAGDDGNITGVGLTLIGANSSLVQGASSDNYAVAKVPTVPVLCANSLIVGYTYVAVKSLLLISTQFLAPIL